MVAKGFVSCRVPPRAGCCRSPEKSSRYEAASGPGTQHGRTLPTGCIYSGGALGGAHFCRARGRRCVNVCPGGGPDVELGLEGAECMGVQTAWPPVPTPALTTWATLSESLNHAVPPFPRLCVGVVRGWR